MSLPQTKESSGYPLNVGEQERKRLEITNEIYNPSTFDFLQSYIPHRGQILEVGCGHGQISRWLGVNGRGSQVTGIDQNPEQIRIAAAGKRSADAHIEFAVGDIACPDFALRFEARFDLVFCRFTLLHIRSIDAAITRLFSFVKPGGYLVVEEPSLSSLFCIPYVDAFHIANEAIRMYGKMQGVSYDCAEHLWTSVHRLDGSIDRVRFSQPTIWEKAHKELVALSFMQFSPLLIERGIIDRQTSDGVIAELYGRFMLPEVITGGLRTIQLAVSKAA